MPAMIKIERATPEKLETLGVSRWSSWECGIETFDWQYSSDETAYVMEGHVRIRTEHGQDVEIRGGDIAFFPKGLRCTWTVLEPIRKVYAFS